MLWVYSSVVEHPPVSRNAGVQFPVGSRSAVEFNCRPVWWNGRHAGLRNQCPEGRPSSSLGAGTRMWWNWLYTQSLSGLEVATHAGSNPAVLSIYRSEVFSYS